jgi:hypothetical protein
MHAVFFALGAAAASSLVAVLGIVRSLTELRRRLPSRVRITSGSMQIEVKDSRGSISPDALEKAIKHYIEDVPTPQQEREEQRKLGKTKPDGTLTLPRSREASP